MYSTKTVSSQTTSPWIPLDDNQAAFSATVAVAVSGTLTYTVPATTGDRIAFLEAARFAQANGDIYLDFSANMAGTVIAYRLPDGY